MAATFKGCATALDAEKARSEQPSLGCLRKSGCVPARLGLHSRPIVKPVGAGPDAQFKVWAEDAKGQPLGAWIGQPDF